MITANLIQDLSSLALKNTKVKEILPQFRQEKKNVLYPDNLSEPIKCRSMTPQSQSFRIFCTNMCLKIIPIQKIETQMEYSRILRQDKISW